MMPNGYPVSAAVGFYFDIAVRVHLLLQKLSVVDENPGMTIDIV